MVLFTVQIQFSAFHIQVFHPQLTFLYAHPVHQEKHAVILLALSPAYSAFFLLRCINSLPLPLFWCVSYRTAKWALFSEDASTVTGISGINQCLSTPDQRRSCDIYWGAAMSRRPHYARATSPGSSTLPELGCSW